MKTLASLFALPLLLVMLVVQPVSAREEAPAFSEGEIRQLLAPIALYPDALLSQMLIAATYPLEVVEAARWSRNNPGLKGQQAVDAVSGRDWDLSIKALVAFPEVLARMSVELDWTRRLGDAFLFQEAEVVAAIQDLRLRAEEAGTLAALDHARARRDGEVIVIEPADPRVVYVPYYSPRLVYGGWWWPHYPPYFWTPPGGHYGSAGFYWGSGIVLGSGFFFSSFDWGYRHIVILRPYRHHFRYVDSPRWRHDPKHRRGVVYRDPVLQRQFGRTPASSTPVQPARAPALNRDRRSTVTGETGVNTRRAAPATTTGRDGALRGSGDRRSDAPRPAGGRTVTTDTPTRTQRESVANPPRQTTRSTRSEPTRDSASSSAPRQSGNSFGSGARQAPGANGNPRGPALGR